MEICKNGKTFYIKREIYETDETLILRAWFIGTFNPQSHDDFNEAVRLSKMYASMKTLGCRFSDILENNIKLIIDKMNY